MKHKNIIILGGDGFIAKSLLKNLLLKKNKMNIFLIDRNIKKNLIKKLNNKNLFYVKSNLEKESSFVKIKKLLDKQKIYEIHELWNLCANSDIKISNLKNDLNNTFLSCFYSSKLLDDFKVLKYFFSSSSAIYGHSNYKLDENIKNFNPISMYGYMKLNCENYLKYLSNEHKTTFLIFRFPNVVGPNLSHGVIFDFLNKIKKNKHSLLVLGNGNQKKPYLYVDELIEIIYQIAIKRKKIMNFDIFNISPDDNGIKVKDIAILFKNILFPKINIKYSSKNNFGWKGDVPNYKFDIKKIKSMHIYPKFNSRESIIKTLRHYIPQ